VEQLVTLLVPAAAAAVLAWLLTPLSAWLAWRLGAIDRPGPRRIHDRPIPRLGGLAVIAACAAVLGAGAIDLPGAPVWVRQGPWLGMLAGAIPILLVSIRDDIAHVGALPKIAAHAVGAAIAIWSGVALPPTVHLFDWPIELGWMAVPLSAIWLIGVTNSFNLVDGLDGLSAGLGLIAAGSLAGVLLLANQPGPASAAVVLAGGILGFLPYNLHPARVFLGDAGATAIGFVLGCLTLTGSALLPAGFATLIPVVLLGVPVAETVVSILRRTIARAESGEGIRIHEADRSHIHHRLLDLGFSHRHAVLILYGVGIALSLTALASLLLTRRQSGLLLLGMVLAGIVGLNKLGYGEFALVRRRVALRFHGLPVMQRSFFAVFVDIVLVSLSLYLTVALKLDDWTLAGQRTLVFSTLALLVPTHVAMFAACGTYRGSWRLAGVHDLLRLNLAIACASLTSAVLGVLLGVPGLSISLFALFACVEAAIATGCRVLYRRPDRSRRRGVQAGTWTMPGAPGGAPRAPGEAESGRTPTVDPDRVGAWRQEAPTRSTMTT